MTLTHAMILAAGLGTRMRPLTNSIPKPLIPVAGKPLIDWCLEWLSAAEIPNVVINTSYRAQQLEEYLAERYAVFPSLLREGPGEGLVTKPPAEPMPSDPLPTLPPRRGRALSVRFSREEPAPLETGGGIVKALPMLGDAPFLTLNADAIFLPQPTHPITRLRDAWSDDLDFLMLLIPTQNAIGWQGQGDFIAQEDGRIRRPRAGEEAPYIFSGVEIIHPRVFVGAPEGAFSLSKLWNARADETGYLKNIRAVIHDGLWLNVGDLAGLKAAEDALA